MNKSFRPGPVSGDGDKPRARSKGTKQPMLPDRLDDSKHTNLERAWALVREAESSIHAEINDGNTDQAITEVLGQLTAVKNRLKVIVEDPPEMRALDDIEKSAKNLQEALGCCGISEAEDWEEPLRKLGYLLSGHIPHARDSFVTQKEYRGGLIGACEGLLNTSWKIYSKIEYADSSQTLPRAEAKQLWEQVVNVAAQVAKIAPIVPGLYIQSEELKPGEASIKYEETTNRAWKRRIIRVEKVGIRDIEGDRFTAPAVVVVGK